MWSVHCKINVGHNFGKKEFNNYDKNRTLEQIYVLYHPQTNTLSELQNYHICNPFWTQ